MSKRSYQSISPTIGEHVFIDERAVVIGDVHIGADCSVWPNATIRGDMHRIRIGQRTNVQDNACLHITHASQYNPEGNALTIGDDVTIGHSAVLHGCTIHNRVLIGIGSIVLDQTVIEDDVILAAGSFVPQRKTLKSGWMYMGSPAKAIRELTEDEKKQLLYGSINYVRLKNTYLELASHRWNKPKD